MALQAGVKIDTPCLTVNRLCGSGFQSVVNSTQDIQLGDAEISVAAGAENMSMAPYILRGARFGTRLGTDLKVGPKSHSLGVFIMIYIYMCVLYDVFLLYLL